MQQIEKTKRQVARPLKVLVPLIKKDLHDGDEAAERAGMPFYIAAGRKLLEAKATKEREVNAISWGAWLKRNFQLSREQARAYMRAAEDANGGIEWETLSHARGDFRPDHQPAFTEPVKDVLKNLRRDNFNLRQHDLSVVKEERLEHQLAIKLIDIGYKVLAVELHPDKGGSAEAMQRLNRVRARLKEAI
jgi:hypothetical protein